ncbi:Flp1 family type IVb pilin [Aminipila butyrica]|uniref:Flp1 family type IVb pilin n=1 Tax=Aminipila butyrica TaxID=433296 RepID=UPI001FEA20FD|nr:Flp1 family type IVb pilin [Aminipila butyrica]
MKKLRNNKKGMEMVQVGILIAIAIGIGLIFKNQITEFINGTFSNLMNSGF